MIPLPPVHAQAIAANPALQAVSGVAAAALLAAEA